MKSIQRLKALSSLEIKNVLFNPITFLSFRLIILNNSNHMCFFCYIFIERSSSNQLGWFYLYIIFHYPCNPTNSSFTQLSLCNVISHIEVNSVYEDFIMGHIMLKLFQSFHNIKNLIFNKWVAFLIIMQYLTMKSYKMFFLFVIFLC